MIKVETFYAPSNEVIENLLNNGWKIEAAWSEPTRLLTNMGHYGGENHFECQIVIIFTKTV